MAIVDIRPAKQEAVPTWSELIDAIDTISNALDHVRVPRQKESEMRDLLQYCRQHAVNEGFRHFSALSAAGRSRENR